MSEPETHSDVEIATAYHEAGHAVMALVVGRPVHRVSILPNHLRLGHCELSRGAGRPSKDALESEALFLLAGLAAEAKRTDRYAWGGAASDLRAARALIATRAETERQAERLERRFLDKTEYLLADAGVWMAVERIAAELLLKKTVSGRAVRHFYDEAEARAEKER